MYLLSMTTIYLCFIVRVYDSKIYYKRAKQKLYQTIYFIFFFILHQMNQFGFNYFPGNIPNISEGIVERKVCFLGNQAGNFCVHHLQIQVKNCGDYRVYYLYPTPSNDEAYCFGKDCIYVFK